MAIATSAYHAPFMTGDGGEIVMYVSVLSGGSSGGTIDCGRLVRGAVCSEQGTAVVPTLDITTTEGSIIIAGATANATVNVMAMLK